MTFRQANVLLGAVLLLGVLLVAIAIETRDNGEDACGDSELLRQLLDPASERPNIDDGDLETWSALEAATCRPLPYAHDLRGLHLEAILVQRGVRGQPPDPALGPLGGYASVVFYNSDELGTGRLRLEVSPYPLDERSYFTPPQEEPRLSDVKVQGELATVTQALAPAGSINIMWQKDGWYFRAFCNFGDNNNGRFTLEEALRILNSIR